MKFGHFMTFACLILSVAAAGLCVAAKLDWSGWLSASFAWMLVVTYEWRYK